MINSLKGISASAFALGLHQEPKNIADYPLFGAEYRRHVFWMAFILDKSLATFFGRPPMINGKYCSCKMPMDFELWDLALEGTALKDKIASLDSNGWNLLSPASRVTWLRGSIIAFKMREEILELSLGGDDSDLENKARSEYLMCCLY